MGTTEETMRRPEVAVNATTEVKLEGAKAILSDGPVEISKELVDKRAETLALAKRLLASAAMDATFSIPEPAQPARVTVALTMQEALEAHWFRNFRERFEAMRNLHPDDEWTVVERSLKAAPDAIKKLRRLDDEGFEMNVFRAKKPSDIQFRTGQLVVPRIASDFRNITYNKKNEDFAQDKPGWQRHLEGLPKGNAVDSAIFLGCELADQALYDQLHVNSGWLWLKSSRAYYIAEVLNANWGAYMHVSERRPYEHDKDGSFCAALTIKKVSV